jgi:hypothetical protein
MNQLTFLDCTYIAARQVVNTPIQFQFDALVVVANQTSLHIIVTKDSITATQVQFDILVKNLIHCVHQN